MVDGAQFRVFHSVFGESFAALLGSECRCQGLPLNLDRLNTYKVYKIRALLKTTVQTVLSKYFMLRWIPTSCTVLKHFICEFQGPKRLIYTDDDFAHH